MKKSRDDYLTILFISITALYMCVALAFPMYAILSKGLQDKDGVFIGFQNYITYFESPALVYSIYNSLDQILFLKSKVFNILFISESFN